MPQQKHNLSFFHSLPDAPVQMIDAIRGNISYEDKALNAKAWIYFIGDASTYGVDIGKRIVIEEISVKDNENIKAQEAVVVCSVIVEEG